MQPSPPWRRGRRAAPAGARLSWVSGCGAWGPGERLGPGGQLGCADEGAGQARTRGAEGRGRGELRSGAGTRLSLRSHCALTLSSGARPRSGIYRRRSHAQSPPRGPAPAPAAGARSGRSPSPQPGPGEGARPSPVACTLGVSDTTVRTGRGSGAQCQEPHASLLRARSIPRRAAREDWPAAREDSFPSSRLLGTILEGAMEEVMHHNSCCADSSALVHSACGTESRVVVGSEATVRRPWREVIRS